MTAKSNTDLRRGWTTGACATAAAKAALMQLWGGDFPDDVRIELPRGEEPVFALAHKETGDGWAEVGITKDAGDDPDVTHGALIIARVRVSESGIVFRAGVGVGTVTMPGLPIPVGEPAINPMPRQMMGAMVEQLAKQYRKSADVEITISIPGGEDIAKNTWNPRLGIAGGLSVLGTTGIVRPFSCSAWIASIHRGIDVAIASGLSHVAGCTGATSERAVQTFYDLPDHAMLDMGDFAGGMLKYLSRHPVEKVTIGGGIGKLTKLAQGARDLHSGRSQVDMAALAELAGDQRVISANTTLHALEITGPRLAGLVAVKAREAARELLKDADIALEVVVVARSGSILARAE